MLTAQKLDSNWHLMCQLDPSPLNHFHFPLLASGLLLCLLPMNTVAPPASRTFQWRRGHSLLCFGHVGRADEDLMIFFGQFFYQFSRQIRPF